MRLVAPYRTRPNLQSELQASEAPRPVPSEGSLAKYAKALQRMKYELRCVRCNRKLAEGVFVQISIKCPRCGFITKKAAEPPIT